MRVAAYARASTDRQAETQTIEQQVERLVAYARQQGWVLAAEHIYRDDGYSGARLDRPALDRLRDAVANGVIATGRSDYANQINNVLVFPGFFRGLLDSRARSIDDAMKVAAAQALAGLVGDAELSEEYIIPSVFDSRVVPAVAGAVHAASRAAGLVHRAAPGS